MNRIELMINHAKAVLPHAYAPYSNYAVAACVCSEDDKFYTGVNIENASYGLTICAETSAICQLITSGKKTIKNIAILNNTDTLCTPCGACRQRIAQFATKKTIIYLCDQHRLLQSLTIEELLPFAFKLTH